MVGMDMEAVAAGTASLTLSASVRGSADSVRVFLMDGSFAPVVNAQVYPAA